MKFLICLGLCIGSLSAFSETTIYSYNGKFDQKSTNFFYVSSFNFGLNHCYTGPSEPVCDEVKKSEAFIMKEYVEGAHDYYEVVSCERDHDQVIVTTKLFDDYGTNGAPNTSVFGMCH